jgi:hypothetical protein
MNNKQEKTTRRYVFLATTLLAIASLVTITGLAAQSQKRLQQRKTKSKTLTALIPHLEPQEMTR